MIEQQTIDEILDPKSLPLPKEPEVVEIRYEPYVDHLGDDALWIRVIFAEGTPIECDPSALKKINFAIADALLEAGIELFPYIRYATRAELEEAGIEI